MVVKLKVAVAGPTILSAKTLLIHLTTALLGLLSSGTLTWNLFIRVRNEVGLAVSFI